MYLVIAEKPSVSRTIAQVIGATKSQEGYLEGNADGTLHRLEPGQILVQGISWEGHEFLDSVRDDSIWRQILQRVGGTSATVALHVITQLGDFYIKKRLGIE